MSHVHPREAARSVHSGSGAQYLPVPVRLEVHYCDFAASCRAVASSDNKAPAAGKLRIGQSARGVPLPNPRRFDEQIPVVAQCEAISVFSKTIKHQLALVSVYKKWESAPAPLLSIAHISRALHKDSASVDNRRWAWRVGT